jgi:hypothetical protein
MASRRFLMAIFMLFSAIPAFAMDCSLIRWAASSSMKRIKRICKGSKSSDAPAREPGNAKWILDVRVGSVGDIRAGHALISENDPTELDIKPRQSFTEKAGD